MMKTLIYFHGFQSGAGTATVGRFRRCLPDWRVEAQSAEDPGKEDPGKDIRPR